jgi:hypothetical protein
MSEELLEHILKNEKLLKEYSRGIIPKEGIKPEFHINTLLERILSKLKLEGTKTKEGWLSLLDWTYAARDFVLNLPIGIKTRNAISNELVDPFLPARSVFTQNGDLSLNINIKTSEDKLLYQYVKQMHYACLGKYPTQHLNILEVLEDSKIIDKAWVKTFCKDELQMKQTPKEAMEDFINEMEGGCILNETLKQTIGEDGTETLYTSSPNNNVWIKGNQVFAQGYHGSISCFELYNNQNHFVLIQKRGMEGTSVTNLAESLRDKIREAFGEEVRVYEAYEQDTVNGKFTHADEIIGLKGETAGWVKVDVQTIPGFSTYLP